MVVMGLNPSVGAFLGTNFGMGGRSPRTNRDFGRELAGVPSPGYLRLQVPASQCLQFVIYVFIPPW
ncbi:hypothetical protein BDZ91DRAFT_725560 [Kalaharituber pfeilii]|nr:hypothetical protein BDZ91DRAFT_725560 [Kalaharituber pfeilii]